MGLLGCEPGALPGQLKTGDERFMVSRTVAHHVDNSHGFQAPGPGEMGTQGGGQYLNAGERLEQHCAALALVIGRESPGLAPLLSRSADEL